MVSNLLERIPAGPADDIPYGVVCPHAGYVYSGAVAAHSYAKMSGSQRPPYVMLVGPEHRGTGPALSLSGHARWRTPLGESPVSYPDNIEGCGAIQDMYAHAPEHCLEVQIPMVQYLWGDVPIAPILMGDQSQETAWRLGRHLAGTAGRDRPAFIASSDLTHYSPDAEARRQDAALIETVLDMDTDRFYHTLHSRRVTACGYGAIAAAIEYCRALGATHGRLLNYDTSAAESGDTSSVVGYCAIAFH